MDSTEEDWEMLENKKIWECGVSWGEVRKKTKDRLPWQLHPKEQGEASESQCHDLK